MPNPKKIIIDDAIPFAQAMFSHLGDIQLMPGRDINAQSVKQADALIVRSRTQVNETLLKNSPVSFIGSTVVGLDHIDQLYLKNNGIEFYSAQGCNANSVTEYIITSLLDVAEHKGFELKNKTLGIIGVGHVGSLVHRKAQALGVRCLLNDPPKVRQNPELEDQYVDLESCLKADIITVHTPLTHSGEDPTHHLVSAQKLAKIQPNQIIINAARGGIIDEQAWAQTPTLANIIDCWENEPNIDSALYQTAYLATPHIAGHSLDAKIAGGEMVYQQLCHFWNIEPDDSWKTQLPPEPNVLHIQYKKSLQSTLYQTLRLTYDPRQDDQAIRNTDMAKLHQQYEFYRRNYPIHREWKQHHFEKTGDQKTDKLLISLDFKML
ncbi:MAG: 4-phosphoerythronate dehydrogenase [Thiomicrorhabdus chilensis]|uniref:4-phosphoerythronate dehydrogenase n=1 Tax=Thiomicrorhabdus chilensis TaxID=63656 RepID=UPI00299DDC82|nr:4-phosphoerythronate dehydrogenase [Thiomicrorhabdus chilensis]MDX1347237.1 4-phosphoerythronate dehydrogenase [Thiomicrorhabdus chilensis]